LATGATAIVAGTFGVIEGENRGYGTWWIDVCFAAAAVLVVVFVLIEQRVRDPVFKLEFLRNPTFTAANIVAFATNLSVFSVFFFTALYLRLISHFSGYQTALVSTSLAVRMAASTVNTSRELGGEFGVAVLGAVVNAQLTSGLSEKLVKLGIPVQFREIVVKFVTTGGNITNAENSPAARGHLKIVAKVLVAAEDSAGHGVHLALEIAGGIVLAAAVVAAFAARHRVVHVEEVEG